MGASKKISCSKINSERNKSHKSVQIKKEKSGKSNTVDGWRKSVILKKVNKKRCNKKQNKRKPYSPEALRQALQAVDQGDSLRKAADAYGVSPATILRKRRNPEKIDSKKGPSTIFSTQEEQEIVSWVIYRAERGYPVTKPELLDSVQAYVTSLKRETPFVEGRPGRHWYDGFRKRHPELSIRTVQHLTADRASVTEEDMKEWFVEVDKHLTSKDLKNIEPSRVFNCDETSVKLCPKPAKVLTRKGARSVYKLVEENEKECLTTLFMYNAEGMTFKSFYAKYFVV